MCGQQAQSLEVLAPGAQRVSVDDVQRGVDPLDEYRRRDRRVELGDPLEAGRARGPAGGDGDHRAQHPAAVRQHQAEPGAGRDLGERLEHQRRGLGAEAGDG